MNKANNKYFHLLLLSLILLSGVAGAQPSWQWGYRGGSTMGGTGYNSADQVVGMVTDKQGNLYVLADIHNLNADIGGVPFPAPPATPPNSLHRQVALTSWDCTGNFRWMKSIGGGGGDLGSGIGIDTLGGIYITGSVNKNSSPPFDTDTTIGATNKNFFIIKYNTSGQYQWLKMPQPDTVSSSSLSTMGATISVAPNGDFWLYAPVMAPGAYDNGAFVVATRGAYLIHYNASGVFQDINPIDITGLDQSGTIWAIQADLFTRDHTTGNFYLSGNYSSTSGTMSIGGTPITGRIYLGCFNPAGNLLWLKQNDPDYFGIMESPPALDEEGNLYIAGSTNQGDSWNGHTFTSTSTATIPFVVKMNASGDNLWATNGISGPGLARNYGITVRKGFVGTLGAYVGKLAWDGHEVHMPLATGSNLRVLLATLNATTGKVIRLDSLDAQSGTRSRVMTSDRNGNFFGAGQFQSNITISGTTHYKNGGYADFYFAKYGSPSCNCTAPTAAFTPSLMPGMQVQLSYNGSQPVDSVVWEFGDGSQATGNSVTHTYTQAAYYTICATAYNYCGRDMKCYTLNPANLSAGSLWAESGLRVYPNPVTDRLVIENDHPKGGELILTDMTGTLIRKQHLSPGSSILDMQHIAAGMYLLHIHRQDGSREVVKVMKQE